MITVASVVITQPVHVPDIAEGDVRVRQYLPRPYARLADFHELSIQSRIVATATSCGVVIVFTVRLRTSGWTRGRPKST